jgi:hypothetical protein
LQDSSNQRSRLRASWVSTPVTFVRNETISRLTP